METPRKNPQTFVCTAQGSAIVCSPKIVVESGKITKYLKGGSPAGGTGSKDRPFNSLAQAEAASWQTLVILPSSTVIYGGITLKDGQDIKGLERDKCLLASIDGSVNDGDVIRTNGDNTISRITIVSAYRCGISALLSKDLTVEHCSINNTNTNNRFHPHDYIFGSLNPLTDLSYQAWAAIDFFGGSNQDEVIQAYNMLDGKFTCKHCSFNGSVYAIIVGSGDSVTNDHISTIYHRKYEIDHCRFSNQAHSFAFGYVMLYPQGGGKLSGCLENCTFENINDRCIAIGSIQARNPRLPRRGNFQYGDNTISNCRVRNCNRGFLWNLSLGEQTNIDAALYVTDNNLSTFGKSSGSPASLNGVAAIEWDTYWNGVGYPLQLNASGNKISSPSGLDLALSVVVFGDLPFDVDFCNNTIIGCTAAILIANRTIQGPSPFRRSNGYLKASHNKMKDIDTVLVVGAPYGEGGDGWFNRLDVIVQENCFENVGHRNSPSITSNGSYHGAAVIVGGLNNPSLQNAGLDGNIGVYINIDFGGGNLESEARNSFTNVSGPHTWIDSNKKITLEENYFEQSPPVDAGIGGIVTFANALSHRPKDCRVESSDSSQYSVQSVRSSNSVRAEASSPLQDLIHKIVNPNRFADFM